jgi:transcriptional regulator with XRE-family HTH domain
MPVAIDYSSFPQKLPEKLKQIRGRSELTPDEFAQYVNAKDGAEIAAYENMECDPPTSVLRAHAKFAGIPIENIVDDDRDLWFGHLQSHERPQMVVPSRRDSPGKNLLAVIGLVVVVLFLGPHLVGFVLWFIKFSWEGFWDLFSSG